MGHNFFSKLNIIFLSIIISCFLALSSGLIAKKLMRTDPSKSLARGYEIEITTAQGTSGNSEVNFAGLLDNADLSLVQPLLNKCVACHSFEKNGKNKVGPNLWNIFNNVMGSKEGYKYSTAFNELNTQKEKWTPEKMMRFLKSPKSVVKKTKMTFIGLKTYQDTAIITKHLSVQVD